MREIRGGIFQDRFHNLLISKNNTFWAPQISRITFQVVWGLLRSQYSWFVSVGRCSPPGLSGSACRSVDSAAGALSCAVLAPATQPLTLGDDHDGSSHLRLRCP